MEPPLHYDAVTAPFTHKLCTHKTEGRLPLCLMHAVQSLPHFDNAVLGCGYYERLARLYNADVADAVIVAGRWLFGITLGLLRAGLILSRTTAVHLLDHFCPVYETRLVAEGWRQGIRGRTCHDVRCQWVVDVPEADSHVRASCQHKRPTFKGTDVHAVHRVHRCR